MITRAASASIFLFALGTGLALAEVGESLKTDEVANPSVDPAREKGRLIRGYHRDEELAREIREALVEDDSLSFAAKNVAVLSKDGKVVLRGTVHDRAEKAKVAGVAKNWAGAGAVRDEITVRK
jgi:osmotically-inducible protein OsmY